MDAVSLTLDHLSQRNEQVLFFMADAAADADHIGLKGIDDIRYTGCEIENILIDDFLAVSSPARMASKKFCR